MNPKSLGLVDVTHTDRLTAQPFRSVGHENPSLSSLTAIPGFCLPGRRMTLQLQTKEQGLMYSDLLLSVSNFGRSLAQPCLLHHGSSSPLANDSWKRTHRLQSLIL